MGIFDKLFGPPSRDKFAKMVMASIRHAGEIRTVLYNHSQYRLHVVGGPQFFMEQGYREYCEAPKEERELYIRRFVRGWFLTGSKVPDDFEDAKPDLLPVIRSRSFMELTRLREQIEGHSIPDWPHQLLGDHLTAALAYDLPEAIVSVSQEDLDSWEITFYEAMETARANLAQLEHSFIGPQDGEGVYISATNDNYDASRLLLLDAIHQMQLKGDPIAMVPNRDTLLVAGADDMDALKGMLALANEALEKPRPLSGVALRLDCDEWVSWLPDTSHPLYDEFRILSIQWIGHDYNEQKELLESMHEKTGKDIFVASYSAMENRETGETITYSVWNKDTLSLLPRTERVAFIAEGMEPVMVPWDRVVEVLGDIMKPEEIYPERYRVADFPTPEQLALMGNVMP